MLPGIPFQWLTRWRSQTLKIIYLQGASPDHALWHCRAFKQCCHTSLLMLHVASLGGYIEKLFVCNLLCNNFWVMFCYADWICFWSKQNLTSFKILLKPNSFNILQSQHVLVESTFKRIPWLLGFWRGTAKHIFRLPIPSVWVEVPGTFLWGPGQCCMTSWLLQQHALLP